MSDHNIHTTRAPVTVRYNPGWTVNMDSMPATRSNEVVDHRWILTVSQPSGQTPNPSSRRALLALVDNTAYATLEVRKLILFGQTDFAQEQTRMKQHLKSIVASLNLEQDADAPNREEIDLPTAILAPARTRERVSDEIAIDGLPWDQAERASLDVLNDNTTYLFRPPFHVPERYATANQGAMGVLSHASALFQRRHEGTLDRFIFDRESELDHQTQLEGWLVARETYEIFQEACAILSSGVEAARERFVAVDDQDEAFDESMEIFRGLQDTLTSELARPGPVGTVGDPSRQLAQHSANHAASGLLAAACQRLLDQVLSAQNISRSTGTQVPQITGQDEEYALALGLERVFREVQTQLQLQWGSTDPSDINTSQIGESASMQATDSIQGGQTGFGVEHATQTSEQGSIQAGTIDQGLQTEILRMVSQACQTTEQSAARASTADQGCQTDILPSVSQACQTTGQAVDRGDTTHDEQVKALSARLAESRLFGTTGNRAGKSVERGIAGTTTVDQDNPSEPEAPVTAGPSGTSGTGKPATVPAHHGAQTETLAGDSRTAESHARRLRRQDRRRDRTWNATE